MAYGIELCHMNLRPNTLIPHNLPYEYRLNGNIKKKNGEAERVTEVANKSPAVSL